MEQSSKLLHSALSTVVALGLTAAGGPALADQHDQEQCAGIVKAGKNDCATSRNECHGHVTVDADPEAWLYLPKGTCERLVGARVVKVKDPTPGRN
jgi:uncharacterized membrane protein